MTASDAPVLLCCGQRHWTVRCPDGKVMCELCYDRFDEHELQPIDGDPSGKWDICQPCWAADKAAAERANGDGQSATACPTDDNLIGPKRSL